MSIAHGSETPAVEKRRWSFGRDVWTSLAISVIWLVVLFVALLGPDIVTSSNDGSGARIPSAVVVVVFAYMATRVVARYGYDRRDEK